MAVEGDLIAMGGYAIAGTGLSTMVFYTIRHFVLKISRDTTTVLVDSGQREFIQGLREEVTRLEALIEKMQATISSHASKIAGLEAALLRKRSSAVAALALVEEFDCDCESSRGMREKLVTILHRMADAEEIGL